MNLIGDVFFLGVIFLTKSDLFDMWTLTHVLSGQEKQVCDPLTLPPPYQNLDQYVKLLSKI